MSNEMIVTGASNELPEWLQQETDVPKGFDNVGAEDVLIPRLKLMQAMSPAVQEQKAKPGDIVLSTTGEIVCPFGEKLRIVPIRFSKEYLHFQARNQGGSLIDRSFDPNSEIARRARQQIKRRMDGEFNADSEDSYIESYNFAIWLVDYGMPVILGCSRSNIKHAKAFNAMAMARNAPPFAGVYNLFSKMESYKNYRYYVFQFENAGWVDKELFDQLKELYEALKPEKLATAPDTSEVMDTTTTSDVEVNVEI